MTSPNTPPGSSLRGFVMMDALVAILIFSVGVVGLLAVQANATLLAGDAKYRTDAALQADRLVAQMWIADPKTLVANFQGDTSSKDAPAYAAWVKQLDCASADASPNCLPGVANNMPTVTVTADGLVTITIRWKAPNASDAADAHRYVSVTQVDRS